MCVQAIEKGLKKVRKAQERPKETSDLAQVCACMHTDTLPCKHM